jgi:hypothetical protein
MQVPSIGEYSPPCYHHLLDRLSKDSLDPFANWLPTAAIIQLVVLPLLLVPMIKRVHPIVFFSLYLIPVVGSLIFLLMRRAPNPCPHCHLSGRQVCTIPTSHTGTMYPPTSIIIDDYHPNFSVPYSPVPSATFSNFSSMTAEQSPSHAARQADLNPVPLHRSLTESLTDWTHIPDNGTGELFSTNLAQQAGLNAVPISRDWKT